MLVFEFGWFWGNKWYTLKVSLTCVQKHLNLWNHTQSNQIACEILNYSSHTFLRRMIKCIYFERAKLVQNRYWFSVTRLYSAFSFIDTIACQYSWPEKCMLSEDVINDRNQISTLSITWFKRVWSSINNIEHSCRILYIASRDYVSYALLMIFEILHRFLLHIRWNAEFRMCLRNIWTAFLLVLFICYRSYSYLYWM